MTLPKREHVRFWTFVALISGFLFWWISPVLTPFLVGCAIAYFLDPVVEFMVKRKIPRPVAVSTLMLGALGVFVAVLMFLIPAATHQAIQLTNMAPTLLRDLQAFLMERFPELEEIEGFDDALRRTILNFGETLREAGRMLTNGLWRGFSGFLNLMIFLIIAPVVAFYLLMDWPKVVKGVDTLLPRGQAPIIRKILHDIDSSVAGFVRGQLTVCLLLVAYYSVTLSAIGLPFALPIGITAGMISFVPYIGALVGGVLSIGLAVWTFWNDPTMIMGVVIIFAIGQVLEQNILVPKIVGQSVRLHPVWLLLAVSVFGSLFGFAGMLIAVPLAAIMGVLVRFFLNEYFESPYYKSAFDAEIDALSKRESATPTKPPGTAPSTPPKRQGQRTQNVKGQRPNSSPKR